VYICIVLLTKYKKVWHTLLKTQILSMAVSATLLAHVESETRMVVIARQLILEQERTQRGTPESQTLMKEQKV
jgi:hypothetical protein